MDRGRRGAAMFDFDFALLDESPRERFHAGASLRFASEDACYVLCFFFQESISTNATKNSFARGLQQMSAMISKGDVLFSRPRLSSPQSQQAPKQSPENAGTGVCQKK